MKKLLSIILAIAMLCSMATAVFADEVQNYEYILPIEYNNIYRLQNAYVACDKQGKYALYSLYGKKLSDDYDYIGSFFNEQAAVARKDNESYVINPYGTVLGKFDKSIIDVADLLFRTEQATAW